MAGTTRGFAGATATPTPDDLFDYWLPRLTDPELRALLYLIRRTLGFRKHADTVSLRQFMEGVRSPDGRVFDEGCGIRNRSTLTRALEGLQLRGLVVGERRSSVERGDLATLYRLVFAEEGPGTPAVDPRALPAGHGEGPRPAPGAVPWAGAAGPPRRGYRDRAGSTVGGHQGVQEPDARGTIDRRGDRPGERAGGAGGGRHGDRAG